VRFANIGFDKPAKCSTSLMPRRKHAEATAFTRTLYQRTEEADRQVVVAVQRIAEARAVPMASVALAWMLSKPAITSPIIGATRMQHLDDAIGAVSLQLTSEEISALEQEYIPHAISGHA
jgi:1-deoxyxylulose-5-phosphate synthase